MPIAVLTRALTTRFNGWAATRNGNSVGAIFVLISSVTVAAMMVAVKELGEVYPPWQIMLARTLGQLLMLMPFMFQSDWKMLRTKRYFWHFVRVVTAYFGILGWLYSIAHMPLADAMGISFTKALFLVGLAAMFLGERPGPIGWGATAVGFAGVLIMLGPMDASGAELAAVAGLASAAMGAVTTLAIKHLTRTESTATIMAYPAIGLTVMSAVPSYFTWVPITAGAVPLFVFAALSGIVSQWCFINAYRYGEASALAPVEYTRLVTATLAGYLIFSELPTPLAFIGILLIVLASLASIRRERIRAGIFH